jgi:signal transduction histidine kinase
MDREQLNSLVSTVRRIRHDANNPLTVALGHIELLIDEPERLDGDAIDSLTVVASELRRLIEILRRLEQVRDTLMEAAASFESDTA